MAGVKDCVKLAKETEVNRYYCMTAGDAQKLFEAYRSDPARLVFESFKFGYAQGVKAERAEEKRRRDNGKSEKD